ncbi:MFS transporter [Nocardioides sp. Bht2]|uniref:MFS transporter n=1 Tax=Nocardioides sp. Bht2 TaxID=3392297 RepID=UPI0039B379F1
MTSEARELRYPLGRSRAFLVWGIAMVAYVLAIFHRSSLGVAGLLATERFEISNSELAAFTVLQLLVYAAMQVPVGVLLDRYGPRALLLSGGILMAAGQFAFAVVDGFGGALVARGVVGAGDAMIFASVIRLANAWFPARQVPMVVQGTGMIGQLGSVLASVPLTIMLREIGWTRTFAAAATCSVVVLIVVLLVVRDSPYRERQVTEVRIGELVRSLGGVWRSAGTQLAFWMHFTSQFAINCFALLWGFPFLVEAQGLSDEAASTVLLVMVASVLVIGWAMAKLIARFPYYRSLLVVGVVVAIAVVWAVVLLWPGQSPVWLLVLMAVVTAVGGPASMVAFDVARTFTSPQAIGRVTGLVNGGGYIATLAVTALIGLILDLHATDGDTRSLGDFKLAMAVQFLFWGVGAVQIIRWRRRAIALLSADGGDRVTRLRRGEQVSLPVI